MQGGGGGRAGCGEGSGEYVLETVLSLPLPFCPVIHASASDTLYTPDVRCTYVVGTPPCHHM
eukprot:300301-Chlamydomonas_euryale.AAC.1